MTEIHYSIVAPCYNEEGNLPELYHQVKSTMDQTGEPWELVLVNDGSRDRTLEVMQELHATDPRVHFIDFARNFGHQIAVTAGMDYASGDVIVTMDSDLQHPPSLIPDMLDAYNRGADIVYAVRKETQS